MRLLPALLSVVALAALTLAACSGDDDERSPSAGGTVAPSFLNVVATTVQIAAFADEVAGDRAEVHGIIPAGADPHDFEPTASDLTAIADADVILRHGVGLDAFLDEAIVGSTSAPVVTVTDGIDLQPPALVLEEDGGEEEEGLDPHVWHDPENDKIMVDNIRDALIAADPDGRSTYEANATAYNAVLDDTAAQVQSLIESIPPENRKLVTNHDAFGYFGRRYGLEIVGAVIPSSSTQAEASAGETAALLETIQRENVKAIFAESSVNPDLAEQLANDAGVQIVDDLYGDSLGEPGSGAETVDGMLLVNARLIAGALQ